VFKTRLISKDESNKTAHHYHATLLVSAFYASNHIISKFIVKVILITEFVNKVQYMINTKDYRNVKNTQHTTVKTSIHTHTPRLIRILRHLHVCIEEDFVQSNNRYMGAYPLSAL